MFAAIGPHLLFKLGHSSSVGERLVDLVIEIITVGDDNEGPVATGFALYLLREEDHGKAFTAALCMPEDAQAALVLADGSHGIKGIVDSKVLMVLGDNLDECATRIAE